jgi:hypothetical protein
LSQTRIVFFATAVLSVVACLCAQATEILAGMSAGLHAGIATVEKTGRPAA